MAQDDGVRALFERIQREQGPAIARTLRSYAKTRVEREDLEQDVALALWTGLKSFRGECSERTFALRVAHNQGWTLVARRRRRGLPETLHEEPSAEGPDPEILAGLSERMRAVFMAIHRLPVGLRQVLVLSLEGLTHEEIADVIGISVNNVAVLLSRARSELRISEPKEST